MVSVSAKEENQGFKPISVTFGKTSTTPHTLFIKEHSLKHHDVSKPPGRTLFVLNIPPFISDKDVKALFSNSGKVLSVDLPTKNGFKNGHIVFSKRESLLSALKKDSLTLELHSETGIEKWTNMYNSSILNVDRLQEEINNFMLKYDKNSEKMKNKVQDDDQGWTVVTKNSRNPGLAFKESVGVKLTEKINQGKKKKELTNFYTFQLKESKRKNLEVLRKNFNESKKKVEQMKSLRKFKPY